VADAIATKVVKVNADAPDAAVIDEAAAILRAGRLVAFPTETVYGLGANALDAAAVARIFAAKGRPASDPLIVHIYSLAQLPQIVATIPDVAWQLAHAFWPGPLTLVLPKTPAIPANVSAGLATVAVRMPNHKVPYALLKAADCPVAAPSANRFARPSPTQARHVYDDLAGGVELILDSGPTTIGVESTVLDLTGTTPTILRPGGLPIETLQQVLPNVIYTPRYANLEDAATPAPGMLLKHYSPNVELLLFDGTPAATTAALLDRAAALRRQGQRVGAMVEEELAAPLQRLGVTVAPLGARAALADIAANLFAGMRELERAGVDVILTHTFERSGLGLALWDRLVRATEGKIIQV
jgi:L-threonylcarbamoyladenylate synthase